MTNVEPTILQPVELSYGQVFGPVATNNDPDRAYIQIAGWVHPILYFVGRNGSGKSRTAKLIAQTCNGRYLSADRLTGLMAFQNYTWGAAPTEYKGVPLDQDRQIERISRQSGVATEELYSLRGQPEVALRVAAFVRKVTGLTIDLRETAGFLDPYVRTGSEEYSLLRDEGHGLKELIVLLAAAYRSDWPLLVIDEPELHLHPSITRLWLAELDRELTESGRRAIVVTHEPSLVRPAAASDLDSLWLFKKNSAPLNVGAQLIQPQHGRVTASITENPQLVGQLVFSPRPVLLEGKHDVAAVSTALKRNEPAAVVAQTDLVDCGGRGGVALWLEICTKLGLDVKAVADLDVVFAPDVQRIIDQLPGVIDAYCETFSDRLLSTGAALKQIIAAANAANIPSDERSRANWLATSDQIDPIIVARRDKILEIWRTKNLWIHPQGRLEEVLGIEKRDAAQARLAAEQQGAIDAVTAWLAYKLDLSGTLKNILGSTIERLAHSILEAQGATPGVKLSKPVGPLSESMSQLVRVEPVGDNEHLITVLRPTEFKGYWVRFSRDTPTSKLTLEPPSAGGNSQ